MKRRFTSILVFLFFVSLVKALAQGPNIPNQVIGMPGQGSTWINTLNVKLHDQKYTTTQSFDSANWSSILLMNDFRFNIASDKKIEGIEVAIMRSGLGKAGCIRDTLVVLSKSSVQPEGDNRAQPQYWSSDDRSISYGGPTDLWGTPWTPENINSTNFAVMISVYKDANCTLQDNPQIDQVTVKIYSSDIVKSQNSINIISPFLNDEAGRYKIEDTGKAKILDKSGTIVKTLSIPADWDGTDQNGTVVPIGVYYIIINDEKETSVTVVY